MFTIKPMNTLPPRMTLSLHDHTGYLLRLAYDHAQRTAATEMPDGPHPRNFSLVVALMSMGPISQQQLAEKMRVNRSLVVGIVDELERRGWLERRRDPDDRRSYRLHVTPAGERAVAEMRPKVLAANRVMAARLTDDERARLHQLLRELIVSDPDRMIPGARRPFRLPHRPGALHRPGPRERGVPRPADRDPPLRHARRTRRRRPPAVAHQPHAGERHDGHAGDRRPRATRPRRRLRYDRMWLWYQTISLLMISPLRGSGVLGPIALRTRLAAQRTIE